MAHGGGKPRAAERREDTLRVTQLMKVVGRRGGWMGGWMHGGSKGVETTLVSKQAQLGVYSPFLLRLATLTGTVEVA